MEDDLNLFQMVDDLTFFPDGRKPRLSFSNGRRPQLFLNERSPRFISNGRRPK
jgi:hypothetical protein